MNVYIRALGLSFLTGSLVPVLLAAGLAYDDGFFGGPELLPRPTDLAGLFSGIPGQV